LARKERKQSGNRGQAYEQSSNLSYFFLLKSRKLRTETMFLMLTDVHNSQNLACCLKNKLNKQSKFGRIFSLLRKNGKMFSYFEGSATKHATQWISIASYNQRLSQGCCDYKSKSARTERRHAFGCAKHEVASYLVVSSSNQKRR
jgi:hypothetical protein